MTDKPEWVKARDREPDPDYTSRVDWCLACKQKTKQILMPMGDGRDGSEWFCTQCKEFVI